MRLPARTGRNLAGWGHDVYGASSHGYHVGMGRPRTLDRKAIHLLLGDGLTQTHVARILNVSQQQVSVVHRQRDADAAAERREAAEAAYIVEATKRFTSGLAQHRADAAVQKNTALRGPNPLGGIAEAAGSAAEPATA
jgi:hypothetical protein